jgi:hypothetical protein
MDPSTVFGILNLKLLNLRKNYLDELLTSSWIIGDDGN